jgi:hypothetical protein
MSLLDPTSRYAGLPEIEVTAADGGTRRLGAPRVVPQPRAGASYEVRPGARLDLLGAAALGDSTRWWLIADVNAWAEATRLERPGEIIDLPADA